MRRQIALGNRADQGARHGQQRFGFDQGADLMQQRVPNLRLLGVADRLAGIPPGFRQRFQQNAGQLPIVNREPLRAEQRLIRSLPFIPENRRGRHCARTRSDSANPGALAYSARAASPSAHRDGSCDACRAASRAGLTGADDDATVMTDVQSPTPNSK